MNFYLNSTGIISGAGNSITGIDEPSTDNNSLLAKEPDYTGQIPPMQLRRMSKAVRMGIGAANACLQAAGADKANAISVGTAMGCLQDTDVFLNKMVEQNEQMLTPTSFIQSTHNTVAGQIALVTGCNGHNLTYVQRGHSFEHAMLNTALYLNEHPSEKILVGGIDELTPTSISVMTSANIYNSKILAGEGAVFVLASDTPSGEKSVKVKAIDTFTSADGTKASERLQQFLSVNKIENPDLILSGKYNDERTLSFYNSLNKKFPSTATIEFKKLCGEYATASSFALGLLFELLNGNYSIANNNSFQLKKPAKVLLVNNYMHYVSFWHLEV
ncbi:MAG: hypothetical protein EOP51_05150 [Sphingobacteriales bacterium]|nr:MAG: hypothetical protein EOP51_05150 [Sphingobacteriales bacterium]